MGYPEIVRYEESYSAIWDSFIKESRNGTFLFERAYMDYHKARFTDCSWIVFDKGKIKTLLPGNIDDKGILHSHGGLTYGGWILPQEHLDGAGLLEIFLRAVEIWKGEGIKGLDYKPVPWIYGERPSQEDLYALFRLGGELREVNLSSAIDMRSPIHYNKLRRRSLVKGERSGAVVEETGDTARFMALVGSCLRERYHAVPVHTEKEMEYLYSRFPGKIRMFVAGYPGEEPDAGVMIYDTGLVAHTQYIATTPRGREENLLTHLFDKLLTETFRERRYFDFGTSNGDGGRYLNEGLLRQKYSFGATGVAYSRYFLSF